MIHFKKLSISFLFLVMGARAFAGTDWVTVSGSDAVISSWTQTVISRPMGGRCGWGPSDSDLQTILQYYNDAAAQLSQTHPNVESIQLKSFSLRDFDFGCDSKFKDAVFNLTRSILNNFHNLKQCNQIQLSVTENCHDLQSALDLYLPGGKTSKLSTLAIMIRGDDTQTPGNVLNSKDGLARNAFLTTLRAKFPELKKLELWNYGFDRDIDVESWNQSVRDLGWDLEVVEWRFSHT